MRQTIVRRVSKQVKAKIKQELALYHPRKVLPLSEEQIQKIRHSRIIKSERDERLDISQSLQPPKHYMGGFTVPKALRSYNHQPGGPYEYKAPYESPREDSYKPHEVILYRTRYNLVKGPGYPVAPEHTIDYAPNGTAFKTILLSHHLSLGFSENDTKNKKFWKLWQNTRLDSGQSWPPKKRSYIDTTHNKEIRNHSKTDEDIKHVNVDNANNDPDFYTGFRNSKLLDNNSPKSSIYNEEFTVDKSGQSEQFDLRNVNLKDPSTFPHYPFFSSEKYYNYLPEPFIEYGSIDQVPPRPLPPTTIVYPMLRIILPTNPLARTFSRLSKALPTGMPYVGVIPPSDRKDGQSFFRRMTRLKLNRIRRLLLDVCVRLDGRFGGFPGIRVSHEDRGKGYKGERLDQKLPENFRNVKVLFRPNLLSHDEINEWWSTLPNVSIGFMDDFGREIDLNENKVIENSDRYKNFIEHGLKYDNHIEIEQNENENENENKDEDED